MTAGLFAQLGFAEEVTYGTYVAPVRFLPFRSEDLRLGIERDEMETLGESSTTLRSDRWLAGKRNVAGSIAMDVFTCGFGMLFRHMLGAVAITTPATPVGTPARIHTHTLASLLGRMLTIQVGRPDVGGVVRPFSYLGCKVASWELTNAISGFLQLALTIDGRDETTAQSLAAASYPTGNVPLHWAGGAITIAGVAFPLREISIAGATGIEGDRYTIGPALKTQPLQEAYVGLTGSITADFTELTAYNRFVAGALAAIVATWTGPVIDAEHNFRLRVTMPVCRFDGETPVVEGPQRLTQTLGFKALNDGTQPPITIEYVTTDTAS